MERKHVKNAIIMAAGNSARFAPLSQIRPKALFPVKGEILIERQIRQLKEAGISQIYIIVGYKKELFTYLERKFDVQLIENAEYRTRNNHSSVYAVRKYLGNSYLCSADNYFTENVFSSSEGKSYYAALYAQGSTNEYCLYTDKNNRINRVDIGGCDAWYMCGHVYLDEEFCKKYISHLENEYNIPETKELYWEDIYISHLNELCLYKKEFCKGIIQEFDRLDELKDFDSYYRKHSVEEISHILSISVLK